MTIYKELRQRMIASQGGEGSLPTRITRILMERHGAAYELRKILYELADQGIEATTLAVIFNGYELKTLANYQLRIPQGVNFEELLVYLKEEGLEVQADSLPSEMILERWKVSFAKDKAKLLTISWKENK